MKIKNWALIEESQPGERLVPGGYVAVITNVEDVEDREYLRITYDIAEGDYKGHFDDVWGRNNAWAHQFIRSYKEKAEGMFKAFLNRLEESNKHTNGFNVANWQIHSNEQQFVGLGIGLVLQTRYYTNEKGEDKESLEVRNVVSTQQIRRGDFKLPDPRDDRENVVPERVSGAPATDSSVYDEDVPF